MPIEIPEHLTDREGGHIYRRKFVFSGKTGGKVVCIGHSPPEQLSGAPWGVISRVTDKYSISELHLLNLFSLISPKAKNIGNGLNDWRAWSNVANDDMISECCKDATYVICCWGCERLFYRPVKVRGLIGGAGGVKCFAKNKDGRPYHYRGWNGQSLPGGLALWIDYP